MASPAGGTPRPPLSPSKKKGPSPGPGGGSEGPGPTEGAGRWSTLTGWAPSRAGQALHIPRPAVSRLFAHALESLCPVWGPHRDPASRQRPPQVARPRPMRPPGRGQPASGQRPRSAIRLSRSSCTSGKLSCLGAAEQTSTGTASPPAGCQPGAPAPGEGGGASAGLGRGPRCAAAPSEPSLRRLRGPHGVPGLQERLGRHARGRVPPQLPHAGRGLRESAGEAEAGPRHCPRLRAPRAPAGGAPLTSSLLPAVQRTLRVRLRLPPGAAVRRQWGLRGRGGLPLSAQRGRLPARGHHQGGL